MGKIKDKNSYKLISLEGKELRKNIVFKKNDMVQKFIARVNKKEVLDTKISLLLNFFISLIEPPCYEDGSPLKDKNGEYRQQATKYCIPFDAIYECLGYSMENWHKEKRIKESLEEIKKIVLWEMFIDDKTKHKIETDVTIFDNIFIDYNANLVYISFSPKCMQLLFNINNHVRKDKIIDETTTSYDNLIIDYGEKGEFIAHELIDEIMFKSKYSRPLLEYLISFKGFRTKILNVSDLRIVAGVKKKQYPNYYDFKRRILNEALKEINEFTNFNIAMLEEIKIFEKYPEKIKFLITDKGIETYSHRIKKLNALIDGKVYKECMDSEFIEAPCGMFA